LIWHNIIVNKNQSYHWRKFIALIYFRQKVKNIAPGHDN